jgi:hypothetical protein
MGRIFDARGRIDAMFNWFPVFFSSLFWGGTVEVAYEFLTEPSLSAYSETQAWPEYNYIESGVFWQLTDRLGVSVAHALEDLEWNYVTVGASADLSFGRVTLTGSLVALYPLYDR